MATDETRELDELIAERVFGWTRYEGPTGHKCFGPPGGGDQGCPFFSTDIAAAWLVVEHLLPKHSLRGFGHNRHLFNGSGGYVASFWPFESVAAATAPLAICLAAMKVVPEPEYTHAP